MLFVVAQPVRVVVDLVSDADRRPAAPVSAGVTVVVNGVGKKCAGMGHGVTITGIEQVGERPDESTGY